MKKYTLLLLHLLLVSGQGQTLHAQPVHSTEQVWLNTDRSMYISGEAVLFTALIKPSNAGGETAVLYAELIDSGGKQLASSKTPVKNQQASGLIPIPADVVSGFYYLRAYTHWMRNAGPSTYALKPLKVINPLIVDVMPGHDSLPLSLPNTSTAFQILMHDTIVNTQSEVMMEVLLDKDLRNRAASIQVAVVPKHATTDYFYNHQPKNVVADSFYFHAEHRSISLSGILTDETTGMPLQGQLVSLTIVDGERNFLARATDAQGRFRFLLPNETGSRELFICASHQANQKKKLFIDKDFCSLPVDLQSYAFSLSADERRMAEKMAANLFVQKHLKQTDTTRSKPVAAWNEPFYGKPSHVLHLDDYVLLPELEEYFNELPSNVKVRGKKGARHFRVLGTNAALNVFDPLVLVDQVAVDDPEKILAMSPKQLDRIEVVTEPYVKGDITYGGIVSLITKKGDFGGVDLPASGLFLTYALFDEPAPNPVLAPAASNEPDTRNTLAWWPHLLPNDKNILPLSFQTAATTGEFCVVATMLLKTGEKIHALKPFEIR